MSRGGWGAREKYGTNVTLNVYDLSPTNEFLYPIGLGMFHSGVQIGASEYTFAGGGGVFDHTPLEPGSGATFRESIVLGSFEGGQQAVKQAISELRPLFSPDSYNILVKNCNHFADALCRQLLKRSIPGHVNRLADIGGYFSSCIPKSMLESNGQSDESPQSSSYQVMGGGTRRLAATPSSTQTAQVFGGAGTSLGSASGSSSASDPSELSDRRERMRQARLSKLGGN